MFGLARQSRRYFSTLLVAESKNGKVHPGCLSALTAAQKLNKDIDVLVLGEGIKEPTFQADGVKEIFVSNAGEFKNPTADVASHAVNNFIKSQNKYTHILSMSSTFSKDYFPRLAAMNNAQAVTDIIEIVNETTFKRPTYAGNALATVQSSGPLHFISARPTNFDPAEKAAPGKATEVDSKKLLEGLPANVAKLISEEIKKSERPDLAQAKIVVSGGRGI